MNGYDGPEEGTALARYRGVPNPPHTREEKTRWRRFLEWAMPWLRQKWFMGEALLEARLAQEIATARRMTAEARSAEAKAVQDMMEIVAAAREKEQQKLAAGDITVASPAELEAEVRALQATIAELSWKYGTSIHIDVDGQKDGADPAPERENPVEDLVSGLSSPGGVQE